MADAVKFICWLYDSNCTSFDVNELRYNLFCKKNISGDKLPPTRENLLLHIFRAIYQTYIWKNAHRSLLQLPSPVESKGWVLINGSLNHQYSTKDPAPNQVAELVVCSCKSGCSSNRCSCLKNNFECSEACLCVSCKNDIGFLQNRDEDDDENSDDELKCHHVFISAYYV